MRTRLAVPILQLTALLHCSVNRHGSGGNVAHAFIGICGWETTSWTTCVRKHPEECAACGDLGLRYVTFYDCIDFAASVCEARSCCLPCSSELEWEEPAYGSTGDGDEPFHETHADSHSLKHVEQCHEREGCPLPNCDALNTTGTCRTEYDAFQTSCRMQFPVSYYRDEESVTSDVSVSTWTDGPYWDDFDAEFESESFEPESIGTCQRDASALMACAGDTGFFNASEESDSADVWSGNPNTRPNDLQQCSFVHDTWTRCIKGSGCRDSCNIAADSTCERYDSSVCGKRCCCDECSDYLADYESCVQNEVGCAEPSLQCSDRFCMSGVGGWRLLAGQSVCSTVLIWSLMQLFVRM